MSYSNFFPYKENTKIPITPFEDLPEVIENGFKKNNTGRPIILLIHIQVDTRPPNPTYWAFKVDVATSPNEDDIKYIFYDGAGIIPPLTWLRTLWVFVPNGYWHRLVSENCNAGIDGVITL